MLALYGHPFSSYTWKVLIALYANATPFVFRTLDGAHPEHGEDVGRITPLGKFPLLLDGSRALFESSAIRASGPASWRRAPPDPQRPGCGGPSDRD